MPIHVLGSLADSEPPKRKPRGVAAGHKLEREYKRVLEADGWHVLRSPASKGVADLIAIRPHPVCRIGKACSVLFVEVKGSVRGPFADFRPADRAELIEAAAAAGAVPLLAWRKPRGQWQTFEVDEWPATERAA